MAQLKDNGNFSLKCDAVHTDKYATFYFELDSKIDLGKNLHLCFTTYGHFKNKSKKRYEYKRVGSFIEVISFEKLEKKWIFTIDNISTKIKNFTSGPTNPFLILDDGSIYDLECMFTSDFIEDKKCEEKIKYADVKNYLRIFPQVQEVELVDGILDAKLGFNISKNKSAQKADRLIVSTLKKTSMLSEKGLEVNSVIKKSENGYKIDIKNNQVSIISKNNMYEFYAFITLAQLWNFSNKTLQIMTITDYWKYEYRGVMIDVARQFYTIKELKVLIEYFALLKLNRLHLHLSDDEGWRFKSKVYPQLHDIGAFRGYNQKVKPQLGSRYKKYGGSYGADELKELIKYAKKILY